MEPRARRLYLREQLGRAREALDRGESAEALAAVDAALHIDPEYLAAQALREGILRQPVLQPAPPSVATASAAAASVQRFETRTRGRRIEKRAEAARAALASGRLGDAREAIDEIAAIDPHHPEHDLLLTELAARAVPARRRSHVGPVIAAIAVFGALLLAARYAGNPWGQGPAPASMQQPATSPGAPDTVAPASVDTEPAAATVLSPALTASDVPPVSTSGTSTRSGPDPATDRIDGPRPVSTMPPPVERPTPALAPVPVPVQVPDLPEIAPTEPSDPSQLPGALNTLPRDTRAPPVERTGDLLPAPRANVPAQVPAAPMVEDEDLVLRTLQQYRRAYDTLDARAAQAVWPGVDSVALQRAFDGLVSQRLTFQSCQLQVNGPIANADCRGTARYTPRMGSGEARNEPRSWRFALRRTATSEWQIVSALVAR